MGEKIKAQPLAGRKLFISTILNPYVPNSFLG